jgi:amidase
LLVATDAMSVADEAAVPLLHRGIAMLREGFESVETLTLADEGLESWRQTYRIVSAYESWKVHGEWVDRHHSGLSSTIAERFAFAKSVSDDAAAEARKQQSEIRRRVRHVLGSDGFLVLPSAPGAAPKLQATGDEIETFRQRIQRLTSVAGLAGLPQVSLPGLNIDGAPIGLSLIGPERSDRQLLKFAEMYLLGRPMPARISTAAAN